MSRTDKDTPHWVRDARDDASHPYSLYLDPPPRWFIRARFRAPERRRVRRAARLAAIDHNTNGDTDVEIPTDQHRHGAKWLWW